MRMRSVIAVLCLVLAVAVTGHAEMATPGAPAELKQLDFVLGAWKGTGTFYAMGSPLPFTEDCKVRRVVDGHYLMMETKVMATMPGASEPMVLHESLGLISWDAAGKVFRIKSYASGGTIGESTATVTDGKVVEKLKPSPFTGRGEARFTFWSTGADSWAMLGEQSDDSTTWTKVLDETYARVPAK